MRSWRTLRTYPLGVDVQQIITDVRQLLRDPIPESSIGSCLRLNTPRLFTRIQRGRYRLAAFTR